MNALVLFTDENCHWAGSFLRRGYRHCFCVVPAHDGGGGSVEFNVTVDGLQLTPLQDAPEYYVQSYVNDGLEVVVVDYTPVERQLMPLLLNNCVSFTKQLIGMRHWAWTPWQLRQALEQEDRPIWRSAGVA